MHRVVLPPLPLTGGCQCGPVRYEVAGPPVVFYICHCTECQKQSASAFGESFRVRVADLDYTGALSTFERGSESGSPVACDFCPQCGSRLFHRRPGYGENINIKAGTLDDAGWIHPAGHIWTRSRQPWMTIPKDTLAYEAQPEDGMAALIERWREMLGSEV